MANILATIERSCKDYVVVTLVEGRLPAGSRSAHYEITVQHPEEHSVQRTEYLDTALSLARDARARIAHWAKLDAEALLPTPESAENRMWRLSKKFQWESYAAEMRRLSAD